MPHEEKSWKNRLNILKIHGKVMEISLNNLAETLHVYIVGWETIWNHLEMKTELKPAQKQRYCLETPAVIVSWWIGYAGTHVCPQTWLSYDRTDICLFQTTGFFHENCTLAVSAIWSFTHETFDLNQSVPGKRAPLVFVTEDVRYREVSLYFF